MIHTALQSKDANHWNIVEWTSGYWALLTATGSVTQNLASDPPPFDGRIFLRPHYHTQQPTQPIGDIRYSLETRCKSIARGEMFDIQMSQRAQAYAAWLVC